MLILVIRTSQSISNRVACSWFIKQVYVQYLVVAFLTGRHLSHCIIHDKAICCQNLPLLNAWTFVYYDWAVLKRNRRYDITKIIIFFNVVHHHHPIPKLRLLVVAVFDGSISNHRKPLLSIHSNAHSCENALSSPFFNFTSPWFSAFLFFLYYQVFPGGLLWPKCHDSLANQASFRCVATDKSGSCWPAY